MTRTEALTQVTAHVKNKNLVKHMLAVEAIMRALAVQFKAEPETWGLAGLLHDLDYDETANNFARHGFRTVEMLDGKAVSPEVLQAIRAHAHGERSSLMDQALYATDQLAGLVVAAALIHPAKKLAAIDAAFVLKRFDEKRFAAGANREQIRSCAVFNMTLDDFVALSVGALQGISTELGL
jgi:putative nucleotidyltransferase with HDIG domain